MRISQEKQRRLAYVARRYYLEDQRQSDIARELGVSRPMVSRLLSEARALGVVEITVHDPEAQSAGLLGQLCRTSSLRGGVLVEEGEDNDATNQLLSRGAVEQLRQIGARRLGVGWGYLIGQLVTWLEANPQPESTVTDICPLVGNASNPRPELPVQRERPPDGPAAGGGPPLPLSPGPAGERGGEAAALLHRGLPADLPAVGGDGHRPGEHRGLSLQPGFRLPGAVWEPPAAPPRLRADAGLLLQ